MEPEQFYTTKEVATIFRVKDTAVRAWIKQGKIPEDRFTRTPGNGIRIPASTVEWMYGQLADR